MIKPEEARQITTAIQNRANQELLEKIDKKIREACVKGGNSTWLEGVRNEVILKQLTELGYAVKYHHEQFEGSYYVINW